MRTIVWLRRDFRFHDNAALYHAAKQGAVIPVYIHAPEEQGKWAPGGASKVWIHHALEIFSDELQQAGAPLIIRKGPSLKNLTAIVKETGADAVFWNRLYDPAITDRDTKIKEALSDLGAEAKSFRSYLLWEPPLIKTGQGKPYQVFTPYWKALTADKEDPHEPLPPPEKLEGIANPPKSESLESLRLLPQTPRWDKKIMKNWEVGEKAAETRFDSFLDSAASNYSNGRNRPDKDYTSRMSPYLHHGHISPARLWWKTRDAEKSMSSSGRKSAYSFLREIGWREFSYHVLYHFPHTPDQPLRQNFQQFPWRNDNSSLQAWQNGQTGYPIVDAGMRQLYETGWMHNRVRMVVASFLCKHLLLTWQEGAAWFWDCLVDADLASNTMGWQWASGCGADAAPYFRIFNPMTQGEKFDPNGEYIRRWVPEISQLSDKFLNQPWEASEHLLGEAGVRLGENYPEPLVEHKPARQRALNAFEEIKKGS